MDYTPGEVRRDPFCGLFQCRPRAGARAQALRGATSAPRAARPGRLNSDGNSVGSSANFSSSLNWVSPGLYRARLK
jgi:hypothetical protein